MDRTGALRPTAPGRRRPADDAADIALVRRSAAQGMVLLKNVPAASAHAVLPLAVEGVRRVAIIGPNSSSGEIMGGGSAHVTPTSVSTPLDAIRAHFEALGVEVVHAPGCHIHRQLPELDLRRCGDVSIDIFDQPEQLDSTDATPVSSGTTGTVRLMWVSDPTGKGSPNPAFGVRLHTTFTPDVSGAWKFGVESVAPARVLVDGVVVADNADVPIGGSFFGTGRGEVVADVPMEAGRSIASRWRCAITPSAWAWVASTSVRSRR